MTKYVYFLLCFTFIFGTGYSLKCYNCKGEKIDHCIKSNNPTEQPCGNVPSDKYEQFCYYKVAYENARKIDLVVSSCINVTKGTAMDKMSIPDCKAPPVTVQIKECRVCNTDLCNTASVFSSSALTFVCLPAVYLLAKIIWH